MAELKKPMSDDELAFLGDIEDPTRRIPLDPEIEVEAYKEQIGLLEAALKEGIPDKSEVAIDDSKLADADRFKAAAASKTNLNT